jgi:hypothetical protein
MLLGNGINGVILTFGKKSNDQVHPVLVQFMNKLVNSNLQDILTNDETFKLTSLHISSTSEPYSKHKVGGPHRSRKAVDISAINGKSITHLYGYDPEVTGICNALQVKAIDLDEVWENFGPLICLKTPMGKPMKQIKLDKDLISMHKTHLHFSVRG